MKICHISSINSLNEISSKGEIEFCLLPFILRSEDYKNYFTKIIKEGKYVICDNGIAENDLISHEEMIHIAVRLHVNEIIVPDVIGDYKVTKDMRESFLNRYYSDLRINNIKIMSVIQGKTLEEYKQCLKEVLEDARIDVIGIPFRINYKEFSNESKEVNHMLNRINFINEMQDIENLKPIHLLGCNLIQEIWLLKNNPFIRSLDSKLITRFAFNNKIINVTDKEKPIKKLYIDSELTKEQIELANINIELLKTILKGGNK